MKRFVFALDLVNDREAIAEYEAWHRADRIWPAVVASLRSSGLTALEIFRTGSRLCLIMEAPDDFSLADKAAADAANPDVQAWERLMWTFQRALPWSLPGEKWVSMERIFSLRDV
ncbi:MAG TPA: L-rhamnose mutarotase [Steroidobacteraceae bacterium]|nr:L-rhamnose mutarotase [Steroidobacteraceae bacterium]